MADLSHRKAEAKIKLIGKDGKPLVNTKVSVNQVNHEFLFGCGAFETLPYTNGPAVHNGNGTLNEKKPLNEHRKQLHNYMRLTHKKYGMLINFGMKSLYSEWYELDEETNQVEKITLM